MKNQVLGLGRLATLLQATLGAGGAAPVSAVPPSWNPLGDMNQSYDPNFPGGSIGKWISKAPTPQSGSGITTLIGTGIPHLPSDGSQGGSSGGGKCK